MLFLLSLPRVCWLLNSLKIKRSNIVQYYWKNNGIKNYIIILQKDGLLLFIFSNFFLQTKNFEFD